MPRKTKQETNNESSTQRRQQELATAQDQQKEFSSISEPLAKTSPESHLSNGTSNQTPSPSSNSTDFLATSLQSAQASIGQLFEKQAELTGQDAADAAFDAFESAFINRLEQRLQPLVDSLLPEIRETKGALNIQATARTERRQSAFDRLKQIAAIVTDECKPLPPVVTAIGEFVSWEPAQLEQGEQ